MTRVHTVLLQITLILTNADSYLIRLGVYCHAVIVYTGAPEFPLSIIPDLCNAIGGIAFVDLLEHYKTSWLYD